MSCKLLRRRLSSSPNAVFWSGAARQNQARLGGRSYRGWTSHRDTASHRPGWRNDYQDRHDEDEGNTWLPFSQRLPALSTAHTDSAYRRQRASPRSQAAGDTHERFRRLKELIFEGKADVVRARAVVGADGRRWVDCMLLMQALCVECIGA